MIWWPLNIVELDFRRKLYVTYFNMKIYWFQSCSILTYSIIHIYSYFRFNLMDNSKFKIHSINNVCYVWHSILTLRKIYLKISALLFILIIISLLKHSPQFVCSNEKLKFIHWIKILFNKFGVR